VLAGGPEAANDLIIQKTRYYSVQRDAAQRAKQRELRKRITIEDRIAAGTILCGSPDTVVKQIARLRDELGVGIVNMNFKVGQMPNEAVCAGLELFRDAVHPRVKDW
jgi:alkanesulfonate monooxygenase SsuD/methylene tetrahydromethanopterin reductase-like flavin-dependent oxidoreductase (luciferase family)